jgi:hypothetical protein
MHLVNVLEYGVNSSTNNFIDNPLVRVEVEGKAGITKDNI